MLFKKGKKVLVASFIPEKEENINNLNKQFYKGLQDSNCVFEQIIIKKERIYNITEPKALHLVNMFSQKRINMGKVYEKIAGSTMLAIVVPILSDSINPSEIFPLMKPLPVTSIISNGQECLITGHALANELSPVFNILSISKDIQMKKTIEKFLVDFIEFTNKKCCFIIVSYNKETEHGKTSHSSEGAIMQRVYEMGTEV